MVRGLGFIGAVPAGEPEHLGWLPSRRWLTWVRKLHAEEPRASIIRLMAARERISVPHGNRRGAFRRLQHRALYRQHRRPALLRWSRPPADRQAESTGLRCRRRLLPGGNSGAGSAVCVFATSDVTALFDSTEDERESNRGRGQQDAAYEQDALEGSGVEGDPHQIDAAYEQDQIQKKQGCDLSLVRVERGTSQRLTSDGQYICGLSPERSNTCWLMGWPHSGHARSARSATVGGGVVS